jgi:transcriptional regulator with XRE-family HTH domain
MVKRKPIAQKGRKPASRAATDVDVFVGEAIRNLRKTRNLTLAELAEMVGLTHQQLQKYETGANRISAGRLYELAGKLGVSILEFFPGEALSEVNAITALSRLEGRVERAVKLLVD